MFLRTKIDKDFFLRSVLRTNALFASLAVGLIFYFLLKESFNFFDVNGFRLLTDSSWFPSEGQYNLIPIIAGTLFSSFGAILISTPLGLFTAFFVTFYAPEKTKGFLKRIIELYAGIPSVIFGFWGLMQIVPLLNTLSPPGQGLLAGILILSLMIFPILTLSLISSFEMSCGKTLQVSESLGLKKSTYIWNILLPSIFSQFIGASLLSLGRALGETMAVLMVCGNIVQFPEHIMSPIRTLTANIALEMAYAVDEHRSALFATGFILFLLVLALVVIGDRVKERF